jgi:hypothetical protein
MHGAYVQNFRCKCETGENVALPNSYAFDGDPVIVGYEGHRDGLTLLQKLTADRLKRYNPYAGDATRYDEAHPVTLASIRRVIAT